MGESKTATMGEHFGARALALLSLLVFAANALQPLEHDAVIPEGYEARDLKSLLYNTGAAPPQLSGSRNTANGARSSQSPDLVARLRQLRGIRFTTLAALTNSSHGGNSSHANKIGASAYTIVNSTGGQGGQGGQGGKGGKGVTHRPTHPPTVRPTHKPTNRPMHNMNYGGKGGKGGKGVTHRPTHPPTNRPMHNMNYGVRNQGNTSRTENVTSAHLHTSTKNSTLLSTYTSSNLAARLRQLRRAATTQQDAKQALYSY